MPDTSSLSQETCKNLLIKALQPSDFARLKPHFRRVELDSSERLAEVGRPVDAVYFPEVGIVTFSDILGDGDRIGLAHVGIDGFSGWPILLGQNTSPHDARITASGGTALRISARDLLDACAESEMLRGLLLRFVQLLLTQMGRTIVSSLTQSVEVRLCRWTLMTHDRIEGDEILVTHDEIAVMLAVRRASVTDTLHILEGEGLIRSVRGKVIVRDRAGLLRHAGEAYGYYEDEYSRLIAPFPRSRAADLALMATEPNGVHDAGGHPRA